MLLDNPVVQQERKQLPVLVECSQAGGDMGKAVHIAYSRPSEVKSVCAHVQISVYHQTRIVAVEHLSLKVPSSKILRSSGKLLSTISRLQK